MWKSYRVSFSTQNRAAENGSISVLFLVLILVCSSAAISSLGYALLWKSKATLQLRLDRCVERSMEELLNIQNTIETSNQRMQMERAAALAAAAPTFGESIEAAKMILAAEVALQETARLRWSTRQGLWIMRRGCDQRNDRILPLPNLRWTRPPPDPLGPRPLEWQGTKRLQIALWGENRFSQATAEGNKNEAMRYGKFWNGKWIKRSDLIH